MNKILTLTQVLTLAGLALLASRSWTVPDELTRLDRELKQHLQAVSVQLTSEGGVVRAQLQEQSNAINRAFRTQIPLRLPADVEEAIRGIEEVLGVEGRWPTTLGEVQQLNERLATVIDSLSPTAQEEVLPRLLPRRWEVDALWLLGSEIPQELGGLLDYQLGVDGHLESKPIDASEGLRNKLKGRGEEVAKAVRDATILDAVKAISEGDMELAARLVGSLSVEDGKELREKLKVAVTERDSRALLDSAQRLLERASAASDLSLKTHAVSRARDAIMDLRVRLLVGPGLAASIGLALDDLEGKTDQQLEEVGKAQRARGSELHRDYQVWALGEIKKVRTLAEIESELMQQIPSSIDRHNPLSNAAKGASQKAKTQLHEAMVRHMAPINQAALDVAVGQWFQKVYQQRFESLDETSRLEVITEFAVTLKKAVE